MAARISAAASESGADRGSTGSKTGVAQSARSFAVVSELAGAMPGEDNNAAAREMWPSCTCRITSLARKSGGAAETRKKGADKGEKAEIIGSRHALALKAGRAKMTKLDPALQDQFASGRLLAAISSRPGQSGRADGYILEGEELVFYKKKMEKKKKN